MDEVIKKWMPPAKTTPGCKPDGDKVSADADKTYDRFLDAVGKTGEINTGIGLAQLLDDKGRYHGTLSMFYKRIIPECNSMSASLDGGDLNRFKISVHAMKAMLAIIGAQALSETALELETAAQSNDMDSCTQKFPQFKERLLLVQKKLAVIFPTAEKKPQTAKVLVVDDMDVLLFVIKDQLVRYGLQVDTASNGREAVEKTKNNVYDLVFMDHLMPEMDGIEAAGKIRKHNKELPIIALTSNRDSDAEAKFLSAGFNGFLCKPVGKPELEDVLKKWLPRAVVLN